LKRLPYLVERMDYRDGSRVLHTHNLLCSVPGDAFCEADDCGVMRRFALPSLGHAFDLNVTPLSFRSTYCRAKSLNLSVAPHHGIFGHSGLELIPHLQVVHVVRLPFSEGRLCKRKIHVRNIIEHILCGFVTACSSGNVNYRLLGLSGQHACNITPLWAMSAYHALVQT
jgi:hypothetical protein